MKAAKPVPILLAEDDPDDRYLISEALDESQVGVELFIVDDGEALLEYLNRQGKFADTEQWPLPRLILLDLNMPRLDGREALKAIKESPEFRRIPVVVLTTSNAEEDIHRTYDLGISGYITKPVSFSGLLDVMKAIGWYWLQVSKLPKE
jgi:two-component system, response regulator